MFLVVQSQYSNEVFWTMMCTYLVLGSQSDLSSCLASLILEIKKKIGDALQPGHAYENMNSQGKCALNVLTFGNFLSQDDWICHQIDQAQGQLIKDNKKSNIFNM